MDIKLVKKAIKGNEKAFEMLVKTDSERIYKTAFLYVRNREDALDVMQESLYKAYMSVRSVKQPEYFKTWLTSIVIRTALYILRKRKRPGKLRRKNRHPSTKSQRYKKYYNLEFKRTNINYL